MDEQEAARRNKQNGSLSWVGARLDATRPGAGGGETNADGHALPVVAKQSALNKQRGGVLGCGNHVAYWRY